MEYRLPKTSDRKLLEEYASDYERNSEKVGLLTENDDFSAWVERIRLNAEVGEGEFGRSLLYLCFDSENLIGLLLIRYDLSPAFSKLFGDILLGVRPSERNKGYATKMLGYALSVCKEKGRKSVDIICEKKGAPQRVIIKNGGVLAEEKTRVLRYMIAL